jgi:Holliday junction resolvasome RuvABC endonuclease subunit
LRRIARKKPAAVADPLPLIAKQAELGLCLFVGIDPGNVTTGLAAIWAEWGDNGFTAAEPIATTCRETGTVASLRQRVEGMGNITRLVTTFLDQQFRAHPVGMLRLVVVIEEPVRLMGRQQAIMGGYFSALQGVLGATPLETDFTCAAIGAEWPAEQERNRAALLLHIMPAQARSMVGVGREGARGEVLELVAGMGIAEDAPDHVLDAAALSVCGMNVFSDQSGAMLGALLRQQRVERWW